MLGKRGLFQLGHRREPIDLANAWREAIVSNDAAEIGRFMADDWVIVSETGISPRREFPSRSLRRAT